MKASSHPERHLSAQGFSDYLTAAVPVVFPVPGDPTVSIFIDPDRQRIGLRTPLTHDPAGLASPLENVHVSTVWLGGHRQLEIAASAPELFGDVYPMLCAIADRIQLGGVDPLAAVDATLEVWSRLLVRRKRLANDREIGLVGELLVLRALIGAMGEVAAVESWRGPLGEEHDFGFAGDDVEMKTTTGESRKHWIGSLTQLVPTPGRPLWLLSVQITRAGTGHGDSLTELVGSVREKCLDDTARTRCDEVLAAVGWSDDQSDLYPQRWTLRSVPRGYHVDSSFPTLTAESLTTLGWTSNEIAQVSYELDLSNRDPDDPPEPLASALVLMT
jgi:hypothetical protein